MFKGFRDFLLRGNVVDLAVAVIIGAAFSSIITSFADDIITPLITAIGGQPDFSAVMLGPLKVGNLLNAIISFIITAAIIYFAFVLPMNRVMERMAPKKEDEVTTRECPECLSDIPLAAKRCAYCTAEVTPLKAS